MPRKRKDEAPVLQAEPAPPGPVPPAGDLPVLAEPAVALEAVPRLTAEERRVAALAHGGILLNLITGIGGPVLALVLSFLYEKKSEYVSWHALQAFVFQGLAMLVGLVLGIITGILWLVTIPLMFIGVGFCLLPLALGISALTAVVTVGSLIYGCVGALHVLDGKDFRYRWVSEWIHPRKVA